MQRLRQLLDAIKFEHTVFALPFALVSMCLAADGTPSLRVFAWVVVAMVGARSSAMMMNRIADRHIDAANPRTAERLLASGRASPASAWVFTTISATLLVVAAWQLNRLAFLLSPVALFVIWTYSWTKRFTWAAHVWLGASLALAPLGAWIAVRGRLDWLPVIMGFGVLLWVAGFDTIYACQDAEFDRRHGLHSLPARFGIRRALVLARLFHVAMLVVFAGLGLAFDFGWLYGLGVAVLALLVVAQHKLVDPNDLRHIDIAFFNVNSIVGVLFLAFALADRFLLG
jgi:4-hydroxybenzoate polyprenyltransferase